MCMSNAINFLFGKIYLLQWAEAIFWSTIFICATGVAQLYVC